MNIEDNICAPKNITVNRFNSGCGHDKGIPTTAI